MNYLVRPRLLRAMRRALKTGHVQLSAPAGYGKTVLLRELAIQRPGAHHIALTAADMDLAVLRARLAAPPATLSTTLILDDVHFLAESDEAFEWLTGQMELWLRTDRRFVLSGRQAMLPQAAVLAAQQQLTLFTTRDLAFTPEESLALGISPEWHARTAGWPLALAMLQQSAGAVGDLRLDPAEATSQLFGHLARALFQGLPAPLLRFMRLSAVPLRFNDALAATLLDAEIERVSEWRSEVMRRNLFIEDAGPPAWYRYHDLIREFLVSSLAATGEAAALHHRRTVNWFVLQGEHEMAIEQALAGGLGGEAARLLEQLEPEFVWDHGRYLTFRRWVLALDAETRAAHPDLLKRLGRELIRSGRRDEGWLYLREALRLAEASANREVAVRVRMNMANAHAQAGDFTQSLVVCRAILALTDLPLDIRMETLLVAGNALAQLDQPREAGTAYLEALRMAEQLGDRETPFHLRDSLAELVYLPLGDLQGARDTLRANEPDTRDRPAMRIMHLLGVATLDDYRGDWSALEHDLAEITTLRARLEQPRESDAFWLASLRASLCTGRGQYAAAEQALAEAAALCSQQGERLLSLAYARARLRRRQARWDEAIRIAAEALAHDWQRPPLRALLALESAFAETFSNGPLSEQREVWSDDIGKFLRRRPGAWLVLLHGWLAVRCYRSSDGRWRRHVRAALRGMQQPECALLLTQREPELGAGFWALCVAEDIEVERATAGLQATGSIQPLLRHLSHVHAAARRRVARALADLGAGDAIPALSVALETEGDGEVRAALDGALTHLESQPPPPLEAHLLGEFVVLREGSPISPEAWHRPITQRLFQYFALRRGERIPRDQILDDLWPGDDPKSAATTFRTVHSRLRNALEPHLRAKSPSRYFSVSGDSYCFDPHDRVRVDTERFTVIVRTALNAADQQDIPSLPPELLAALSAYQPLLPTLPYEEWLIQAREQLHTLYVEGCQYAARAHFVRGQLRDAIQWAERAIAGAPWLEEAYQILMRCHARLDERSLALKTYADVAAALPREVGAPPSPLTEWLAQRLQRGDDI